MRRLTWIPVALVNGASCFLSPSTQAFQQPAMPRKNSFSVASGRPCKSLVLLAESQVQTKPDNTDIPFIRLQDIFPECLDNSIVRTVDDLKSLQEFDVLVKEHVAGLVNDEVSLVGIDCEWRPDTLVTSDELQPVMTLQLCINSLNQVFVLDLKTLDTAGDTSALLSEAITPLWKNHKVIKVGYQHQGDFIRLAASYPHLEVFHQVEATLDIQPVARKIIQISGMKKARLVEESLSRMSTKFLEARIDKTQQMSDWAQRPLTSDQLEYAALDAALTVELLKKLMKFGNLDFHPSLGRKKKDKAFGKMVSSHRYKILEGEPESSETKTPRVKTRRCLDKYVACEEWITGTDPPRR